MSKGPRRKIPLADILPVKITTVDGSAIGLGLDVATTEKETSNPSCLAVTERVGHDFIVRFLARWKTADPQVTYGIVFGVLSRIAPRRARKLCIDATSERYFAVELKRRLSAIVPVDLIVSSESVEYLGEKMTFKAYLGNLLVNTIDDGFLALPDAGWIKDDFRLVKRDRGSFVAEVDENGNHADSFDAVKLSLHAIAGPGGPATAAAAAVGTFGAQPAQARWKNPLARIFNRGPSLNV